VKHQTQRGTMPWSLGTHLLVPTGEQDSALPAPTRRVAYTCGSGHVTSLTFALEAVAPPTWGCGRCSRDGDLTDAGGGPVDAEPVAVKKPSRTHMDMVRERRTDAELEALLDERLALLRARRAAAA